MLYLIGVFNFMINTSLNQKRKGRGFRMNQQIQKSFVAVLMAALIIVVGLSIPIGDLSGKAEAATVKTVVIDPGHGMKDAGNTGYNGWEERAFNSILAYKVSKQLQARGIQVYLTHRVSDVVPTGTDVPVLLKYDRDKYDFSTELAYVSNQVDPDLHLSIHHNSYNKVARGTETFYTSNQANPIAVQRSADAASLIQSSVASLGYFPNRGAKDFTKWFAAAPDAPIKYSNGPAIVFETCFIDNATDCATISNDANANNVASKIADGVVQYLQKYPKKISEDNPTNKLRIDNQLTASQGTITKSHSFPIIATGVGALSGISKVVFETDRVGSRGIQRFDGIFKGNGRYAIQFRTSSFGGQTGTYRFRATAYDNAGNLARSNILSVQVKSDGPNPDPSNTTVGKLKFYLPKSTTSRNTETALTKFWTQIFGVSSTDGIRSVSMRVRHEDTGSAYQFFRVQDRKMGNGSYQMQFDTAAFGGLSGTFRFQAKVISKAGQVVYSEPYFVKVTAPQGPRVNKLRVYIPSNPTDWTKFKMRAFEIDAPSGLQEVSFRVRNLDTNQTKFIASKSKNGGQYFEAMFNLALFGGVGGDYQIDVRAVDKQGREGYSASQTVTVKGTKPPVTGYSIMGSQAISEARMMSFFMANASKYNPGASNLITQYGYDGQGFPKYYTIRSNTNSADRRDNPSLDLAKFVRIYAEEAKAEGVKPEVAFAQMCHETGFLRFGGSVVPDQCNFAGIGATGGGVRGDSYDSARIGIRAQIQHLKAYASTELLKNPQVDQRFKYVTRGCAPTVEGLSGTWAMDPSYATKILSFLGQM